MEDDIFLPGETYEVALLRMEAEEAAYQAAEFLRRAAWHHANREMLRVIFGVGANPNEAQRRPRPFTP